MNRSLTAAGDPATRVPKPPLLVVGGRATVDLLPPEIRAAKRSRAGNRLALVLVVVAATAVGAGTVVASTVADSAQTALTLAQAHTADLIAQQREFTDGRTVAAQISDLTAARSFAVSTEIDWPAFLGPVIDSLPAGATISSVTASAPAAWAPGLLPADDLRAERVATLIFQLTTATRLEATTWVRSLHAVPGYADSTTDSIGALADESGWRTVVTLNVGADARSGRFAPEE